ncbi:MAG: hypothetical protein HC872_03085, partial [Gammaproteobacteria bacterium]|nr:hypothetical protein [Gammaproteobacteria bacterium]
MLTSDGELAQALMRKLSTLRIAFALRVRGEPTLGQLEHLKSGALDEGALEVESVVPAGGEGFNRWIRLVTRGARARDVHRLCTAAGLQISRILRVSIGPLTMARDLARERTQALPLRETEELYALAGLVMKREQAAAVQRSRPSASGRRPALPRRRGDSARVRDGRAGGDRGSKIPARGPKAVRQS